MRKLALRLLSGLLVIGTGAAAVYGMSALIVHSSSPISANPSLALTETVSAYVAALCLGPLLAVGLCVLLWHTVRLLIPARYERANLELARYRKSVGIDAVTAEGLRYVAAWRDLHRRDALLLCVIALVIVPALIHLPRDWSAIAAMGWAVVVVLLVVWQRSFPCPRCGKRFHGKHRTRFAPLFCTHCGLPRDSAPTTAVAPDFAEWKQWNR
jgi:hypothetical protein